MAELVTAALDNGLATITLTRPEAGNAMSWELIDAFAAAAERMTREPGVRAFLIRGEGKNFCVGGDIRSFVADEDPADFVGRLARRLHVGVALLAGHDAPVVVAAQGASAGAGLSLVAGGDIVLAAEDATFSMAYGGIGLTADGGATWLLPRVIGLRATQEMAYLGRRLTARDALELGLVTRLVPGETLASEAEAVARQLAAGPTLAFGGIKRLLAASSAAAFTDHLDAEAASIAAAMGRADAREGVAAFLERRKPGFQAR